jgi:hypothetical protein
MGDIVREFVSECCCSWRRPANVGWAFSPTAQSGRAGRGCCDDVVEVYVRREEDDVVDED